MQVPPFSLHSSNSAFLDLPWGENLDLPFESLDATVVSQTTNDIYNQNQPSSNQGPSTLDWQFDHLQNLFLLNSHSPSPATAEATPAAAPSSASQPVQPDTDSPHGSTDELESKAPRSMGSRRKRQHNASEVDSSTSINDNTPHTALPNSDKQVRLQRRLEKNRISAQESRDRKKTERNELLALRAETIQLGETLEQFAQLWQGAYPGQTELAPAVLSAEVADNPAKKARHYIGRMKEVVGRIISEAIQHEVQDTAKIESLEQEVQRLRRIQQLLCLEPSINNSVTLRQSASRAEESVQSHLS